MNIRWYHPLMTDCTVFISSSKGHLEEQSLWLGVLMATANLWTPCNLAAEGLLGYLTLGTSLALEHAWEQALEASVRALS